MGKTKPVGPSLAAWVSRLLGCKPTAGGMGGGIQAWASSLHFGSLCDLVQGTASF